MTAVQAGGIAVLVATLLVPAAVPAFAAIAHAAAWGLVESARLVDVMPWVVTRVPAPSVWIVAAYYAAALAWLAAARWPSGARRRPALDRWGRRGALAALAAAGAWIVLTPGLRFGRTARVEATFIDVGQGAATLVRFPSGHAMLVDAGGQGGGRFDIGRRVVTPAIWAAGVRRLTYLVVTHGDADHAAGAAAVAADFRPLEIWEGVPVPPEPLLRDLRLLATRTGASWRRLQRRDAVALGAADVIAWHPLPPEWERQRERNDDSVVVEVRVGEVSLVLTGDVETTAEADLARLLQPAGIRVLLAPHHGSATSSTWALVKAAAPDLVIVSAGRGNRYRHPHAAVLARYSAVGACILRTDLDGAVTIRTDGRLLEAETFTGRKLVFRAGSRAPRVPPV
jgi:competence protein ComEC